MTVTVRWLFAIVAICCGIYLLIKAAYDARFIAAGVGLIAAGIGLVVP